MIDGRDSPPDATGDLSPVRSNARLACLATHPRRTPTPDVASSPGSGWLERQPAGPEARRLQAASVDKVGCCDHAI